MYFRYWFDLEHAREEFFRDRGDRYRSPGPPPQPAPASALEQRASAAREEESRDHRRRSSSCRAPLPHTKVSLTAFDRAGYRAPSLQNDRASVSRRAPAPGQCRQSPGAGSGYRPCGPSNEEEVAMARTEETELMARPATGEVLERSTKRGTVYALRFRAHGQRQYLTLGGKSDGWTRERAEIERENVMADVRRGIWQPVESGARTPAAEARARLPHLRERVGAPRASRPGPSGPASTTAGGSRITCSRTSPDYRLGAITVEEVDRYRAAKVREAERLRAERVAGLQEAGRQSAAPYRVPLSPSSINKTIRLLAAIVEQAVEYGHIDRNPARARAGCCASRSRRAPTCSRIRSTRS